MNYELELEAKRKELQDLEVKVSKLKINAASLRVGQCFKTKEADVYEYDKYRRYHKLLYVDDSGHGYKLVIGEHFSLQKLRFFKNGEKDINIPDQYAYFSVCQQHNFESDLNILVEITEEEYNQARVQALKLLSNPQVPKNWAEACSLRLMQSTEMPDIDISEEMGSRLKSSEVTPSGSLDNSALNKTKEMKKIE